MNVQEHGGQQQVEHADADTKDIGYQLDIFILAELPQAGPLAEALVVAEVILTFLVLTLEDVDQAHDVSRHVEHDLHPD